MNGKLRTLGLALFAALALGAVAAAGASAEGGTYVFEASHATYEGTQTAEEEASVFETKVGTVKCGVTTFEGTVDVTEEESEEAREPITEMTVTPTYTECMLGEVSATIDTNECQYTFTEPEETEESAPFDLRAEVRIVNCGEGGMKITSLLCTISIQGQTPGNPATGLSVGSEAFGLLVSPTAEEISYSYSGLCGSGSAGDGTYTGPVEVFGAVAIGARWFVVEKVGGNSGGGIEHCIFAAAGLDCLLNFNNKNGVPVSLLGTVLTGDEPGKRYEVPTVGCTASPALAECADDIKAKVLEAVSTDDYCIVVWHKGINVVHVECSALRM